MSEQQELKEYRQGDTVHLTVELRDENGIHYATAWADLEGEHDDNERVSSIELTGWPDGEPAQAEVVLSATIDQQVPGVYECAVLVVGNAYQALTRHDLDPPRCFRIVEHPDDVRTGPEVLSVGTFW